MIELNTPIIIYPDTYDAMIPVKFEVDFRNGVGQFILGLVKQTDGAILLGTETHTDTGVIFRHPETMYTITLAQNWAAPDPLLGLLMQSLVLWLENLDPTFVESVAALVKQLGTREWSLAGHAVTLGARAVTHEVIEQRSPPPAAREGQATDGPLFTSPTRSAEQTPNPFFPLPTRQGERTVGPT